MKKIFFILTPIIIFIISLFYFDINYVFAEADPQSTVMLWKDFFARVKDLFTQGDILNNIMTVFLVFLLVALAISNALINISSAIFDTFYNSMLVLDNNLYDVWKLLTDMVNALFVGVIVAIGVANVVGYQTKGEWGIKKILPKFIFAVIMVNFSLMLSFLILDISNVAKVGITDFVDTICEKSGSCKDITNESLDTDNPRQTTLSFLVTNLFGGYDKLMKAQTNFSKQVNAQGGAINLFANIIQIAIYMLCIAFVVKPLVMAAAMLVYRTIMLQILLALSPTVWLGFVLPKMGGFDLHTQVWKKWWSEFVCLCFIPARIAIAVALVQLIFMLNIEKLIEQLLIRIKNVSPIQEILEDMEMAISDFVSEGTKQWLSSVGGGAAGFVITYLVLLITTYILARIIVDQLKDTGCAKKAVAIGESLGNAVSGLIKTGTKFGVGSALVGATGGLAAKTGAAALAGKDIKTAVSGSQNKNEAQKAVEDAIKPPNQSPVPSPFANITEPQNMTSINGAVQTVNTNSSSNTTKNTSQINKSNANNIPSTIDINSTTNKTSDLRSKEMIINLGNGQKQYFDPEKGWVTVDTTTNDKSSVIQNFDPKNAKLPDNTQLNIPSNEDKKDSNKTILGTEYLSDKKEPKLSVDGTVGVDPNAKVGIKPTERRKGLPDKNLKIELSKGQIGIDTLRKINIGNVLNAFPEVTRNVFKSLGNAVIGTFKNMLNSVEGMLRKLFNEIIEKKNEGKHGDVAGNSNAANQISRRLLNIAKSDANYYEKIGMLESNGNYKVKNRYGYLGKYQLHQKSSLQNVEIDGKKLVDKDGNWINGWSEEKFLNDNKAQDEAMIQFTKLNRKYIIANLKKNGYIKDESEFSNFVKSRGYTEEAILAAGHLTGHIGAYELLIGKADRKDGNGIHASTYAAVLGGQVRTDEQIAKIFGKNTQSFDKNYISKKSTTSNGMNDDMIAKVNNVSKDFFDTYGVELVITDGYRSLEEQEKLKEKKPGLAATPGKSMHGAGLAIDFDYEGLKKQLLASGVRPENIESTIDAMLLKRGLYRPMPVKEPWHVEHIATKRKEVKDNIFSMGNTGVYHGNYYMKFINDDEKTIKQDTEYYQSQAVASVSPTQSTTQQSSSQSKTASATQEQKTTAANNATDKVNQNTQKQYHGRLITWLGGLFSPKEAEASEKDTSKEQVTENAKQEMEASKKAAEQKQSKTTSAQTQSQTTPNSNSNNAQENTEETKTEKLLSDVVELLKKGNELNKEKLEELNKAFDKAIKNGDTDKAKKILEVLNGAKGRGVSEEELAAMQSKYNLLKKSEIFTFDTLKEIGKSSLQSAAIGGGIGLIGGGGIGAIPGAIIGAAGGALGVLSEKVALKMGASEDLASVIGIGTSLLGPGAGIKLASKLANRPDTIGKIFSKIGFGQKTSAQSSTIDTATTAVGALGQTSLPGSTNLSNATINITNANINTSGINPGGIISPTSTNTNTPTPATKGGKLARAGKWAGGKVLDMAKHLGAGTLQKVGGLATTAIVLGGVADWATNGRSTEELKNIAESTARYRWEKFKINDNALNNMAISLRDSEDSNSYEHNKKNFDEMLKKEIIDNQNLTVAEKLKLTREYVEKSIKENDPNRGTKIDSMMNEYNTKISNSKSAEPTSIVDKAQSMVEQFKLFMDKFGSSIDTFKKAVDSFGLGGVKSSIASYSPIVAAIAGLTGNTALGLLAAGAGYMTSGKGDAGYALLAAMLARHLIPGAKKTGDTVTKVITAPIDIAKGLGKFTLTTAGVVATLAMRPISGLKESMSNIKINMSKFNENIDKTFDQMSKNTREAISNSMNNAFKMLSDSMTRSNQKLSEVFAKTFDKMDKSFEKFNNKIGQVTDKIGDKVEDIKDTFKKTIDKISIYNKPIYNNK